MKRISVLAFVLMGNLLFAQRDLTIQEATMGQYRSFYPKSIFNAQWQSNDKITHLNSEYTALTSRKSKDNWTPKELVSLEDLKSAIKNKLPKASINLTRFPNYTWKNDHTLSFQVSNQSLTYFLDYDINSKTIIRDMNIDVNAEDPIVSRNQDYIAWLKDNNIIVTNSKGQNIDITQDNTIDFLNGSKDTHRNEFGINQGMWWSPKQDQLLYYRKDQSMVSDYPLVDYSTRVATVKNIKYPMAGMANEQVTLVIHDINTGKKVTLQTGEPLDQFLTMVTWDPSGNYVYVGVLNREQNHLKLNKYNAATGAFESTLLEEKANTYTEPSQGLLFNPKNDKEFVYMTELEGYRQAYLYNTDGKLLKKLGFQDVVVTDMLGFDTDAKHIYYVGTDNNGLDRMLYKVNLKKATTEKITTTSGTHNIVLNPSKSIFLDQFSNLETPNKTSIVEVNSKEKSILISEAENPYEDIIDMPKMELLTITAADGTTPLNARIIYPTNFDESKKYPVMLYVYGGPHAQLIQNNWLGGSSLFFQYMAQKGYIVFTIDNRGSAYRGKDFEHIIHRQLGQVEMADQLKGIDYLKSQSFVDTDKIGVYGWSFGGFMATTLSIHHPEIFKVGVAGGPVMDWKYYEIMYGERYMDTPQDNPEGYAKTSLVNKAVELENPLLIIHGAQDPVVVQQHSMAFVEACIKAGKQVDYFLYPTHEHNVIGTDRIHLNQKIADYFFLHLTPAKEDN